MAGILIRNVRVRRARKGYAIYMDKFRCGLSSDILANKWFIDLYKTKCNLEYTTQQDVRSEIKILTR